MRSGSDPWLMLCATAFLGLAGCGRLGYAERAPADGGVDAADAGGSSVPDAPDDVGLRDVDPDSADAPVTGVSLEDFSATIARLLCEARDECLGDAASDDVTDADCATLLFSQLISATVPQLRDAEGAGRFTYDPSFAAACLAALPTQRCELVGSGYPAVCRNALQGHVATGDACNFDLECAFEDVCEPTGAATCPVGTCVPRRGVGGACTRAAGGRTDALCMPGLRCVRGQCALPIAEGDVCDDPDACAPRLLCSGFTTQRCVPVADAYIAELDMPCNPARGIGCATGLSCGGAPFVCNASASSTEPCTPGLPDPCPLRFACDPVARRCVPLPGDGMPCEPAWPIPCDPPLLCAPSRVCRRPTPEGLECESAGDCSSRPCVSGHCVPEPLCG